MARGTTTHVTGFNSLASYKAMYQPLSDIINQSMTRTADTGQVNWATIGSEPTGVRDYEVFALGGSLQATAPVFIRIDYQGGSTGFVAITVGTATDGAGNLSGFVAAKTNLNTTSFTNGLTKYAFAASDQESYFTFLNFHDPNATGTDGVGMCVVERTRDAAGEPTGAGYHVWRWARATATTTTFLGAWSRDFTGAQSAVVDYNMGVFIPDVASVNSAFVGQSSKAFPACTYAAPLVGGPSKALMFGFLNDFPRSKQVTMDYFGQTMTFLPLNEALRSTLPYHDTAGTLTSKLLCLLLRWD